MRVLAGDIGGTKTALAIIEVGESTQTILRLERYASARYPGLEEIVEEFLSSEKTIPRAGGFGVAGPVRAGRARITKLPWILEAGRLSDRARIPRVALLNDFVAAALGLPYLPPRQLVTIAPGRAGKGEPIGLLGAGTGLGEAAVVQVLGRVEIVSSEGGHVDFGPRNPLEDGLVLFLRRRFRRASRDRILSGGGLCLIYDFLQTEGHARETPSVSAELRKSADRAAVISRHGLSGKDRLCRAALNLFVSIYGSEAGNLALQYRAAGGIYIGGGIAPKILPALRGPRFLRAFRDKPPMEELLARIPVRVVLDSRLGLYGAAAAASRTEIDTTRLP